MGNVAGADNDAGIATEHDDMVSSLFSCVLCSFIGSV